MRAVYRVYEESDSQDFADEKQATASESAMLGAAYCAFIGGALGWLAGLGILTIQEVESFTSSGPIMGIVAGVGLGGMVGCLGGWLTATRTPYYESERNEIHSNRAEQVIREDKLIRFYSEDIPLPAKFRADTSSSAEVYTVHR